jgi:hypothetical protein
MIQLPLRLFVAFADSGGEHLKVAEKFLANKGYFLTPSGVRWAPYAALRKAEFIRIPPPPGFVRQGRGDTLAAPVPPMDATKAGKVCELVGAGETDRANHESQFRRLIPASNPLGSKGDNPWVAILSDWSQRPSEELINRIQAIFRPSQEPALVPTVIVVDDLSSPHADHELLLNDLTMAGAIPLVAHSQEEFELIRTDPFVFAATQVVAMQAQSASGGLLSPQVPTSPDAYKEFAKAVTRLSPEAMQDVIKGRRTDDWRYSI